MADSIKYILLVGWLMAFWGIVIMPYFILLWLGIGVAATIIAAILIIISAFID